MTRYSFPDHKQNFWQLACIQGAAQSIPGMLIGNILMQKYGIGAALTSICIGNLILWLIGLGIISMGAQLRKNVIQVAQEHLGSKGGKSVAILLMLAFVCFYIIELDTTQKIAAPIISGYWASGIGLGLGLVIAWLSRGGISWIKRINVALLPILLMFVALALIFWGENTGSIDLSVSLYGVLFVIAFLLPGFVNLSTFFRHSASHTDSILGLGIITLIDIFIQSSTAFIPFQGVDLFLSKSALSICFVLFVALTTCVAVNIVNIYFASVSLETFFPKNPRARHYFWIGTVSSILYAASNPSSWVQPCEIFISNCIVNLGIILLISFLLQKVEKERRRAVLINGICWGVGCLTALGVQIYAKEDCHAPFLAGIWATVFSFLILFFIEEMLIAWHKIKREKKRLGAEFLE